MAKYRKYERAVARGIKWLNKHSIGWRGRLNQERLDLGDCDQCMIGQTCGSYHTIMDELFPGLDFITRIRRASRLGFITPYVEGETLEEEGAETILLTLEWKRQLPVSS